MTIRNRQSSRRRKQGAVRRRRPAHRQYGLIIAMPRLRVGTASISGSHVLAMMIFLAMVALLIWFWVDLRFYVFEAEIEGNTLVSTDEIYQASLLEGMSIFYVCPADVVKNIRKAIPGVVGVHVKCQLPNRVHISIREQDVHFIWHTAGAAFLVDDEGLVLKMYDGRDGSLITIRDLDNRPLKPGDHVERVPLSTASRLRELLPGVKTFEYAQAIGIILTDARGWRVYFGDDQRLSEKVATMYAMLDKLAKEGRAVRLIDLRFVSSPYYE